MGRRVARSGHPIHTRRHHLAVADNHGTERATALRHIFHREADRLPHQFFLCHRSTFQILIPIFISLRFSSRLQTVDRQRENMIAHAVQGLQRDLRPHDLPFPVVQCETHRFVTHPCEAFIHAVVHMQRDAVLLKCLHESGRIIRSANNLRLLFHLPAA